MNAPSIRLQARLFDSLLQYESEDMRWLRERSAAIAKAHAEMIAERESEASERNDARFNETNEETEHGK